MPQYLTRDQPLVISSMEQLEQHLEVANRPGDRLALARMCAYVRTAHFMCKEEQSLLQEATISKWRTPDWVPTKARPAARTVDPNAPAGVNTPRMIDQPQEWAAWMWRYPRELQSRPGIRSSWDRMLLSSVRGMQMAMGRAPRGDGTQRAQNTFLLRVAELLATRGMYRTLVDQLRLTIASTTRFTMAWTSDNVTLNNIAWVLVEDGVTIPQVRDTHDWGVTALNQWAQNADVSRRTEAMTALSAARQLLSQEDQDRPVPLEPAWWYPPAGRFRSASTSTHQRNMWNVAPVPPSATPAS